MKFAPLVFACCLVGSSALSNQTKTNIANGMHHNWLQHGMDIIGGAVGAEAGRGTSLSSDGTTLAVGAPFQNEYEVYNGRVRVYRWDDAWLQLGSNLDGNANVQTSGEFISLSSDGNTIAVDDGHVKVYRFDKEWVQMGGDILVNGDENDKAGMISLSNDGNTVAYHGRFNKDVSGVDYTIGYVRVHRFDGTSWQLLGTQIDGDESDSSNWGVSLSGDSTTLAIGSLSRVRMYRYTSDWEQIGSDIELPGLSRFVSLSDDGNTLAVAATNRVNTYRFDGEWAEIRIDLDETYGTFEDVSLNSDGTVLAVGAETPEEEMMGSIMPGMESVKVYYLSSNNTNYTWVQLGSDIDAVGMKDDFGAHISLSADGETVAIAGPKFDDGQTNEYDDQGHVRVFKLSFAMETDGGFNPPGGETDDGGAPPPGGNTGDSGIGLTEGDGQSNSNSSTINNGGNQTDVNTTLVGTNETSTGGNNTDDGSAGHHVSAHNIWSAAILSGILGLCLSF